MLFTLHLLLYLGRSLPLAGCLDVLLSFSRYFSFVCHSIQFNSIRFVNNTTSYLKLRWNWTNIKRKYYTKQEEEYYFLIPCAHQYWSVFAMTEPNRTSKTERRWRLAIRKYSPYYNLVRHTTSNNLYSDFVRFSIFGRLPSEGVLYTHFSFYRFSFICLIFLYFAPAFDSFSHLIFASLVTFIVCFGGISGMAAFSSCSLPFMVTSSYEPLRINSWPYQTVCIVHKMCVPKSIAIARNV